MPPRKKQSPLMGLDRKTLDAVPVRVGEKVALLEEHDDHPGRYGLIKAIGFDPDGPGIRLDVWVFDPFDGVVDHDADTVRVSLEEIQ